MRRSQFTPKNILFVVFAIIVAGTVAVGWGLSEMQTISNTIVVSSQILTR